MFGDENPSTLTPMQNLGAVYYKLGRDEEAKALFKVCYDNGKKVYHRDDHPDMKSVVWYMQHYGIY